LNTQILKQLVKNEASTQREVYYQHADRLMAIVLRYVKNVVDAEEVIQDSFVQIFEKIKNYDSTKGSFESWTTKIAINYALMHLRKKKKMVFYEEDIHAKVLKVNNEAVHTLENEDIEKQIKHLDEKYRVIFKLKAIEGFSHQEIAKLLGINKEASRTIFSRARKQLRNLFDIAEEGIFASKKGIL